LCRVSAPTAVTYVLPRKSSAHSSGEVEAVTIRSHEAPTSRVSDDRQNRGV
jgi:hypothetical protein